MAKIGLSRFALSSFPGIRVHGSGLLRKFAPWILALSALPLLALDSHPRRLRISTYNLDYYAIQSAEYRNLKSGDSLNKVARVILSIRPDVLALQEVAGPEALRHLQRHLDRRNLSLPFSHITFGADTNIQVAVLSRFPITRHYDHSDKGFSLYDRYQPVLRNFLEVEIQATTRYRFRLITAHLKSKRPVFHANESEIRLEEARILRSLVVNRLKENPRLNLIVLGDLNDFPNSKTLKLIKGSGKLALVDARPAEIQLRTGAAPAMPSRRPSIAWTHYFEAQDTYSRLDYLLLSPGMKSEWVPEESFVYSGPRWGDASDHRPLLVTFEPLDQEASNRR